MTVLAATRAGRLARSGDPKRAGPYRITGHLVLGGMGAAHAGSTPRPRCRRKGAILREPSPVGPAHHRHETARTRAFGGAGLPVEALKAFEERYDAPILDGYGL